MTKKYKLSDFELRDVTTITQGEMEKYHYTMSDLIGDRDIMAMQMAEYRRHMIKGAFIAGWFKSVPDGFDPEELVDWRPGNVQALGRKLEDYRDQLLEPDEDFI